MPRIPRTIVGFAIISAFTYAIDLGILALTRDVLRWPLPLALFTGYAIAFTLSYFLNRRFNFRSHAPVRGQLAWYLGVVAVNLGIVVAGASTLAMVGVEYLLARILAGACEAVWMYCAMRWIVFRARAGQPVVVDA